MNNEPFRVSQPRWKRTPDGGRTVELSIEWGDTPPAFKKELKRSALATGKMMIEDRIQSLQAGLDELRSDVQAFFEMLEEDEGRRSNEEL
jgi:hypothetical protein